MSSTRQSLSAWQCLFAMLFTLSLGVIGSACVVGERPSAADLSCADGACTCAVGFGNCDGSPSNGCESNLMVDQRHCGGCGQPCSGGSCEGGQCVCNEGSKDCNGDPVDGCESLLRVDPENCGECTKSCRGGGCADSLCQPYLLAELGSYIDVLAADETSVYYCDGDGGVIYRVNPTNGIVETIATDQNCFVSQLTASKGHAFWTVEENSQTLIKTASSAGNVQTVATPFAVDQLASSGDRVFWTEYSIINSTYQIQSAVSLGTSVLIHQSDLFITELVADGTSLYWLEEGELFTVPLTGGPPTSLALDFSVFIGEMAVVDDFVYWSQKSTDTGPGADDRTYIMKIRNTEGIPEVVAIRARPIDNLVGDGSGIYWTEDQGDRLVAANLDGTDVRTLLQFQDITLLTVLGESLYWIDFPSHLFALAR